MYMPIKRSPIHAIAAAAAASFEAQSGWLVADMLPAADGVDVTRAQVILADQSDDGKILIEGVFAAAALGAEPLPIGGSLKTPYGRLYRLRPDLLFAATAADELADGLARCQTTAAAAGGLITVTDVSQGRGQLLLMGPRCRTLLSRLCGINLSSDAFPAGTARQTSVAKTAQLILCHQLSESPGYSLIGPRSLTGYLWQTILAAGEDLNIVPVGKSIASVFLMDIS